jgi:uncharacterized RDD family membrane protein YckC
MAIGDIVLLRDHAALGPYTRAQIQEGLSRGEISGRDLAHTPGLKDWFPLVEVLHHLDREPMHVPRPRDPGALPPLPSTRDAGSSPSAAADLSTPPQAAEETSSSAPRELPAMPAGKSATPPPLASGLPPRLPRYGEMEIPSPAPSASPLPANPSDVAFPVSASDRADSTKPPTLPETPPAPLRRRFLAWAIDWAVLFVPVLIVFAFAYVGYLIKGPLEHRDPETARQEQALLWRNLRELLFMVAIGCAWIYAAGLESSRWQGTVGKQCMGLIVTDEAGRRLSFLRATGRHAAKYLSAVPLFLGFMAALFNAERLTWHDRLAGTRVVER